MALGGKENSQADVESLVGNTTIEMERLIGGTGTALDLDGSEARTATDQLPSDYQARLQVQNPRLRRMTVKRAKLLMPRSLTWENHR